MFQELQLQRIAAEQRQNAAILEEQQRREREAAAAAAAAAAARRNNERHECNANASPDVKAQLKVSFFNLNKRKNSCLFRFYLDFSHTKENREGKRSECHVE
jgi:hypothetical protein